jgi:tetratricopeptide (TPR) repeat protein
LIEREDLEGARDAIGTIDREDGDPARAVTVANLLRAVKQPERARALVDVALRAQPDLARARVLSALLYEEAHRNGLALAEYGKVPSDDKDYPDAVRRAVELLEHDGKHVEAAAWVEGALRKAPDEDDLVILASDLDERRGDLARATHRLEQANKARPGHEPLVAALATVLDHAGDWRRGVELMRQYLTAHPDSATALNFVGYAYAEHGAELGEAERLLRRAVGLAPQNGYIEDSLGWCLYKQGKVADALKALLEANRLAPGEAEILRHLGDVYLSQKDRAHATESYKRALDHAGTDERLRHELEAALRELEAGRSARRP